MFFPQEFAMNELMLFVNMITIVLLIVGLWYSLRLSKRIDVFLKSRGDLSALFRMFDETIAQAQTHTKKLGDDATEVSKELQHSGDEARLLLQDLRQTCVRAEKIYDKAERGLLQLSREVEQGDIPKLTAAAAQPLSAPNAKNKASSSEGEAEVKLTKEQMLENMLKKASMLKKKNEESLTQKPANTFDETPDVTSILPPKSKAESGKAGDIEDAGEAIKRALNALGLEEGTVKKRKK